MKNRRATSFDHAVVQKGDTITFQRLQPLGKPGVDVGDAAVIRYNVTAVDGVFGQEDIGMKVRFRAEGARG
jgi:hypothetical protein